MMDIIYLLFSGWALIGGLAMLVMFEGTSYVNDPFQHVNILGKAALLLLYSGPFGLVFFGGLIIVIEVITFIATHSTKYIFKPITNVIVNACRKQK